MRWFSRSCTHDYLTKYINEIFHYAIIKSDVKPSSIEELTISHLHSYLGMRGYIKGIGAMLAEEKMVASEKGHENGLGVMSAEERMAAGCYVLSTLVLIFSYMS